MTSFKITLGILKVSDSSVEGSVVLETSEAYPHEDYDDTVLLNDIALIKLPESVEIEGSVFHHFIN